MLSNDDIFTEETTIYPATEWEKTRQGTGVEHPEVLVEQAAPRRVVRCFAFIDLCGSTAYLESAGAAATVNLVNGFRACVRDVTAKRGVRVAKWMGDGVMLVGVTNGPVIASVAEICGKYKNFPTPSRAGVASSPALLFDGDDYLGRGANLAARFCEMADSEKILCSGSIVEDVPEWVGKGLSYNVSIRGIAEPVSIIELEPWGNRN